MNYLLAFHILLGVFILTQFLIRAVALVMQGANPAKSRFKSLIVVSSLIYSGILLGSADKLTFGNIGWSILALMIAWISLETILKISAGIGERQQTAASSVSSTN